MKPQSTETTAALRLEYLISASYYFFKAEGDDEQLHSALNRMKAQKLALSLGSHVPKFEEVRAFAVERFPAHKRHE